MPPRGRSALMATGVDAAHSWTSASWPWRGIDKDVALKPVSESSDTNAHAQWPKTTQRRILVGVICSQQMKISPLSLFLYRFISYAERAASSSVQAVRRSFVTATQDEKWYSTNRYCVCMFGCRWLSKCELYGWIEIRPVGLYDNVCVFSSASKSELDRWDRKQNVKTFSDTSWTEQWTTAEIGGVFGFFLKKLTLLEAEVSHSWTSTEETE